MHCLPTTGALPANGALPIVVSASQQSAAAPTASATAASAAMPFVPCVCGVYIEHCRVSGAELEDPMGDETNDLPYEVFMGAANQASKVNKLGWPPSEDQLALLNIPADAV